MANPLHLLLLFLLFHLSNQLQPSQYDSLLQILQLLNLPFPPSTTDFCNFQQPSPSLTLLCYEDNITQLHIIGTNVSYSLPPNFTSHSFFSTLSTLSSLKVLSLVSLGFFGPLPPTLSYLSSLEFLNITSNHFTGSIPDNISSLSNLQTLILDNNNFSGTLPHSLTSLPLLSFLSLNNNSFSGSLPKSFNSMQNLRVFSLSNNHFSGEVGDLHNLKNLQLIDLSDNHFGPHFPRLGTKLVTILLRNNRFQYGIPSELAFFYELEKLDISINGFVGPFLPSLFSLPSITFINISHNKFTGMLFENMSCNTNIDHVDFSSNLLSGELPSCFRKTKKKKRVVLYGENCLSNHEQKQHPSNFCTNQALAVKPQHHNHKYNNNNTSHGKAAVAGTIGALAILGLVFFVTKRLYTKLTVKKPQARFILEKVSSVNAVKLLSDARHISQTMKLGATLPAYRTFAMEELQEATNNFDPSNMLGLGDSSSSEIYKGKLGDGSVAGIRRLTVKKKQCQQMMELISKLRHSHLVSSLGHCFDCCPEDSTLSTIFLVLEFVPNGTLRDYTCGFAGKRMNWKQRIGAGIGVAKGIQFLQNFPALYSSNTLKITDVVVNHDLHVKVSTYKHLLLFAETEIRGTTGGASVSSLAPKQTISKEKEDVYELGVILVEIIVGRPVMSDDEVALLKDLLQVSTRMDDAEARRSIVDPMVSRESGDKSLKTVMEICVRCLSDDRPSIDDIIWNLHFATQLQDQESHNNNQHSFVSCAQV
ncbi:probable inactive leucine-rich repeat receptor-like protein kinase At3g03770 [Euphorbia lathyris]|uniref:probable inactive leucine-rich repeat receptor-like protein kinase At3g03770 n=1 Tax=Euphorbia lathyris TaxID=212925 RepID=UPI0033141FBC